MGAHSNRKERGKSVHSKIKYAQGCVTIYEGCISVTRPGRASHIERN